MKHPQHNLRKAAIVVASLDRKAADALLGQMPARQAALLRTAADELGDVDPSEQSQVVEEFMRLSELVPARNPPGIDLDGGAARPSASPQPAEPRAGEDRQFQAGDTPFQFLQHAESETLAPFLEREHPQTIAVVLSHLAPERAAQVLSSLPSVVQTDVARRLVDLEETDPQTLREVERGLESWLSEHARHERRRTAGLAALQNILEAADSRAKQDILSNLALHDRTLAARLAEAPGATFSFADLAQFDDASLTIVLHSADTEIVILALAGATPQMVERVLGQLPLREAKTLRYALDHLGPTRLSDVERAQRELANLAQQLERGGQLPRTTNRGFSLAV